MRIYLIRHGETDFNREGRYQGSLDISLSEEGWSKLARAAFCPEVVYTSSMRRTQETASLIFPEAVLVPVEDLREMSFGDYEGRSKTELASDPEYVKWLSSGFTGVCPNAEESHEEFVHRTACAFASLVDTGLSQGREVLAVVAHGGTQMAVLSSFADQDRAFGDWLTGNGEGYVLGTERWERDRILTVQGQINCCK